MRYIILLLIAITVLSGCTQVELFLPEPEVSSQEADLMCNDYCINVDSAEFFDLEYNLEKNGWDCICLDEDSIEVEKLTITSLDSYNVTTEEITEEDYDTLRWGELPITFSIDEKSCGRYESGKIRDGFIDIEESTYGILKFQEEESDANIEFTCSYIKDCYKKTIDIRRDEGYVYYYEDICAYTRGLALITEIEGNTIKKAEIEMIGLADFGETNPNKMSGFFVGTCGTPSTEIHEILHTFGYDHIDDPNSIMYPTGDSVGFSLKGDNECADIVRNIDKEIVDDLIAVYGK